MTQQKGFRERTQGAEAIVLCLQVEEAAVRPASFWSGDQAFSLGQSQGVGKGREKGIGEE